MPHTPKNKMNTPRYYLPIVLASAIFTNVASATFFPFANGTFDNSGKLAYWSIEAVRAYRDAAIGDLTGLNSNAEKDNAADPNRIAYCSGQVEELGLETELDLTSYTGLIFLAIQVDDVATLTVKEKVTGEEPEGHKPIDAKFEVKGTALWKVDRSYKEFPIPIPAGRVYEFKLDYANTANLTDKYDGYIDYDGVNVFLMHQTDFDLAIASYGNEPNLPEEHQADGNPTPTPHEMYPGATVIAPIAGSNGEKITSGKRARLTLTCDGNHAADGIYTLSSDSLLTKLKIYDQEEGGDPITLPIILSSSDFITATQTLYVGSDVFNPDDKIEVDTLTFTYHRPDLAGDAETVLKDHVTVTLTPIEVIQLSPLVKDELGNPIPGSAKPNWGRPLSPFVEEDPYVNRIAHRELKVRIGSPAMVGKKVTWTLVELPGAISATIRGKWSDSPIEAHQNAFEESAVYGKNGFDILSGTGKDAKAETSVSPDGHTAIRVNVPPIGFNQVRIRIQVEGFEEAFNLIDMEVPAVVVIDPGHGTVHDYEDSSVIGGAGDDSGEYEHAFALDLSQRTRTEIRKHTEAKRRNIKVFMTRENEINITAKARAKVARENGCDVYMSIHFNDWTNRKHRDPFGMWDATGNLNLEEDKRLAIRLRQAVQAAIAEVEPDKSRDADRTHYNSEHWESSLQKGLDTCSDLQGGLPYNGNIPGYTPCRASLIEIEWMSHSSADALYNTAPLRQPMRAKTAEYLADACIQDILLHP